MVIRKIDFIFALETRISRMTTRIKILDLANISSGLYLPVQPLGNVNYLQVKDFSADTPTKIASKVEATPRVMKNLLHKGDILLASKGVYMATQYKDDAPAVASTSFFVLRVQSPAVLPEYLHWYLNQPQTEQWFKSQQQGTGILSIRKSVVEDLEVPVPSLETQRQVVALGKLVKREYELRTTIAEKERMLKEQILLKKIRK